MKTLKKTLKKALNKPLDLKKNTHDVHLAPIAKKLPKVLVNKLTKGSADVLPDQTTNFDNITDANLAENGEGIIPKSHLLSDTKPALRVPDQIELLKSRGLNFADEIRARKFLINVSYYRMGGYFFPFWEDKVNHIFMQGTTFEQAEAIYHFDKKLRNLLLSKIEILEIALRTKLVHYNSIDHGPRWYEDAALFKKPDEHSKTLKVVEDEVMRSRETFIATHKTKHGAEEKLPSWKTLEVASFGSLIRLYVGLNSDLSSVLCIYRDFDLQAKGTLSSWLMCISEVRNICAHHARLWDRHFEHPPKPFYSDAGNWLGQYHYEDTPKKVYSVIGAIEHLLRSISAEHSLLKELNNITNKLKDNSLLVDMGFPDGWKEYPFWQNTGN